LLVSLFLTWSNGPGRSNFAILFGALDRLSGEFGGSARSAWEAYSVADLALAALAIFVIAAVISKQRWLRLAALIAAAAGLVFTIDQLLNPPRVALPKEIVVPTNIPHDWFASASGAGETVAIGALIASLLGLAASLAYSRGSLRQQPAARSRRR
jgi:hypothetical protein